jgi:hypothetical protein
MKPLQTITLFTFSRQGESMLGPTVFPKLLKRQRGSFTLVTINFYLPETGAVLELSMKHSSSVFALLLLSILSLSGCEVIGDIFKAGVWVGVILVIVVVGVIAWIVSKSRG